MCRKAWILLQSGVCALLLSKQAHSSKLKPAPFTRRRSVGDRIMKAPPVLQSMVLVRTNPVWPFGWVIGVAKNQVSLAHCSVWKPTNDLLGTAAATQSVA